MKKTFKKSLIVLFALAIVMMTMALPTESADADVSITFESAEMENAAASSTGLRVTNLYPTASGHESVEGYHIKDGVIKCIFSEEMDISTLTPENIKIKLAPAAGKWYISESNPRFNFTTKEWSYTPYEVTSTSYSLSIADMCEGVMVHKITFTSGVKTANGTPINEVTKKFQTGRIVTTKGTEGKELMDVAFNKDIKRLKPNGTVGDIDQTNNSKMVDFSDTFDQNGVGFIQPGGNYVRIDLGNYYKIYDVVIYSALNDTDFRAHKPVGVAYSNDPAATYNSANVVGTMAPNQYVSSGTIEGSEGGRGYSRYLSPAAPFTARYIFLRVTNNDPYGESTASIKVIADVNADYGRMSAEKDGVAVTQFAGAGTYEISVPVRENKAGTGDAYMIVAAYDANGVVTKLNSAPVSVSNDKLTLLTTIDNEKTKSLKAILVKSSGQTRLLTDALILAAQ